MYPSKAQEAKLFDWRRLHCYLYNSAVADRRDSYKKRCVSVNYLDQQNRLPAFKETWGEYKELGSQALQNTLKRVDLAYQGFFKRLRGYPKFKSIRHYSGWTYPAKAGWKAETDGKNGHLNISNLGRVQITGQARTWGTPTTCTIVCRNGKWYASITVDCEPQRGTGAGAIGLDFGCNHAVATSDGTLIENPRFLGKSLAKVRSQSKQLRRKKKRSRRWKKVSKKVSKLQRKIANQRQDWTHKVAAEIVRSNSLVATEKLSLNNMTRKATTKGKQQKAGLDRSILDVGIGALISAIKYKLTEVNGVFVEVPTQQVKPSQTCPQCGNQVKKTLAERVHSCIKCGYVADRDVAAAKVMLNWATGLGTNLDRCGLDSSTNRATGRQLAKTKRQKLLAL